MKRFILRTLLYLSPLLVALAYYLLCIDKDALRGDLAQMTQDEFRYTRPGIDPFYPAATCRDIDIEDITTRKDCEMVVFGDSFSDENTRWPNCRWHQFMGSMFGHDILNVRTWLEPVDCYLKVLVNHPQSLGDTVVIECVERAMIYRFCYLDFNDTILPTSSQHAEPTKIELFKKEVRKPIQYYQRRLGIDVPAKVATLDSSCFTCRPNKLYYFEDDLIEHNEWELATALANYQRLDSLSSAKGVTLFLVAIPDKYTVYHHHIIGNDGTKKLLEEPCPFDTLPRFINTLPPIAALVASGTKDVYLPDDTHFSNPTCQVIGQYVASRISTSSDTIYGRP